MHQRKVNFSIAVAIIGVLGLGATYVLVNAANELDSFGYSEAYLAPPGQEAAGITQ